MNNVDLINISIINMWWDPTKGGEESRYYIILNFFDRDIPDNFCRYLNLELGGEGTRFMKTRSNYTETLDGDIDINTYNISLQDCLVDYLIDLHDMGITSELVYWLHLDRNHPPIEDDRNNGIILTQRFTNITKFKYDN